MNTVCTTEFVLCRASQIMEAKLLRLLKADVAKLVDARDLKFLEYFDFIAKSCTPLLNNQMKNDRKIPVLHNGFWHLKENANDDD